LEITTWRDINPYFIISEGRGVTVGGRVGVLLGTIVAVKVAVYVAVRVGGGVDVETG
jgi:hypothetical protein